MQLLFIIIITLILSAFFSGMEIAFISANKLRIELDKKQNIFSSNILQIFSKNPSQYISTMLIGNNLALVIYGIVMAAVIEPTIRAYIHHDGFVLFTQTIMSTLVILVIAEFMPKTLFRINPNQTLRLFAIPVYFFYLIFYPIAKFTTSLSRVIIKLVLRANIVDDVNISFNKIDLDHVVSETQGEDEANREVDHDVKIFQNALDFSSIKIRECVVPRTELVAVSINETVEELKQKFIETGHSKILVYQDSIDNIIGFAASMQLFKKPDTVKEMVQVLPIVPESMQANKLLAIFIQDSKSMALVVDEFGGTSGIVTMEDILEEIVGDIQDEHDKVLLIEEQLSDKEFKLSGRLEIDNLNEKYNMNLPVAEDYETIAGLILANHGSIPKVNDMVIIQDLNFRILKATTTKIELVHLKIS
ncbi:MAG: hemolysin family protein [Salinivirgaceae bacterium]|jgi:CBS domain containing-hemolysin-like protein|nr:hemolysin family protein [Salinivirgaceae bacterium]